MLALSKLEGAISIVLLTIILITSACFMLVDCFILLLLTAILITFTCLTFACLMLDDCFILLLELVISFDQSVLHPITVLFIIPKSLYFYYSIINSNSQSFLHVLGSLG